MIAKITKDFRDINSPVFHIKRLIKIRKFIFILVTISILLTVIMGFFWKVSVIQSNNSFNTKAYHLHIQL